MKHIPEVFWVFAGIGVMAAGVGIAFWLAG